MFRLFLYTIVFYISFQSVSFSSQSMAARSCHFKGLVKDVSVRKEPGQGISHGETLVYIDVTIDVIEGEYHEHTDGMMGCSVPHNSEQVLQMHGTSMGIDEPSLPKVGKCIKGSSRYSGDGNFMSGNWLTVVEELPTSACENNPS